MYAWLITLCGALCLAWVFAQLAAQLPQAGGALGVVRTALGDKTAFFNAWGYLAGVWTGIAAITVAAVSYPQRLLPVIGEWPFGRQGAALLRA